MLFFIDIFSHHWDYSAFADSVFDGSKIINGKTIKTSRYIETKSTFVCNTILINMVRELKLLFGNIVFVGFIAPNHMQTQFSISKIRRADLPFLQKLKLAFPTLSSRWRRKNKWDAPLFLQYFQTIEQAIQNCRIEWCHRFP